MSTNGTKASHPLPPKVRLSTQASAHCSSAGSTATGAAAGGMGPEHLRPLSEANVPSPPPNIQGPAVCTSIGAERGEPLRLLRGPRGHHWVLELRHQRGREANRRGEGARSRQVGAVLPPQARPRGAVFGVYERQRQREEYVFILVRIGAGRPLPEASPPARRRQLVPGGRGRRDGGHVPPGRNQALGEVHAQKHVPGGEVPGGEHPAPAGAALAEDHLPGDAVLVAERLVRFGHGHHLAAHHQSGCC
mmetsp:Transcript_48677/g.155843  ORF Transcript_48677/g.155843 Transcript_48677/m.155843 type:complete len:248 (+) Transcript_48677:754-1497(+)